MFMYVDTLSNQIRTIIILHYKYTTTVLYSEEKSLNRVRCSRDIVRTEQHMVNRPSNRDHRRPH